MAFHYDIVGDPRGRRQALERVLHSLGYQVRDGAYRQKDRVAVFLGGYAGGPDDMGVIGIVRRMRDAGQAIALLGREEFEALCHASRDVPIPGGIVGTKGGASLRRHQERADRLGGEGSESYASTLAFYRTLALWHSTDGFLAASAYAAPSAMATLGPYVDHRNVPTEDGLVEMMTKGTRALEAVRSLVDGPKVRLPDPHRVVDPNGHRNAEVPLAWWSKPDTLLREAITVDMPDLGDVPFPARSRTLLARPSRPTFCGRYALSGAPRLVAETVACLDFAGDRVVAYRWDGERTLIAKKFSTGVEPPPPPPPVVVPERVPADAKPGPRKRRRRRPGKAKSASLSVSRLPAPV